MGKNLQGKRHFMRWLNTARVCVLAFPLVAGQPVHAEAPMRTRAIPACPTRPAQALPPSPLADKLAALALAEHQAFNGHRINVTGHLWSAGPSESETEALHAPALAEPAEAGVTPDRLVWRRVWTYWQTLARHVPEQIDVLPVKWLPGLLEQRDSPEALKRARFALLAPLLAALPPDQHSEAIRQATVRAAINDTPWSAAFISYLMDQAGLDETQFRFSEGHVHYVRAAFAATTAPVSPYAYRACDVQKTVVQPGDLLCYGRGSTAPITFADWQQTMSQDERFAAAHCELVVEAVYPARRVRLVGGNVLQSVALRELALDRYGHLSGRHLPSLPAGEQSETGMEATAAAPDPFSAAARQDFNRHPWAVLLKLQPLPAPAH